MKSFNKFVVYKQNILHNLSVIKSYTSAKICVMVKADGYGYGKKIVAKLLDEKVDFFGVANGVEALELKKIGIKTKMLVCGVIKDNLILDMIKNNISITCNSIQKLEKIAQIAQKIKKNAYIHIKINSGMNRLGVKGEKQLDDIMHRAKKLNYIVVEGIFTHSGFSELEDKSFLEKQFNYFHDITFPYKDDVIVHFANSGSFCYKKEYHQNMVRIGKLIYGVNASNSLVTLPLRVPFGLFSEVIQVQDVKSGEYIGYGLNKMEHNGRIAILPLGYGDGFLSIYTGKYVIINHKRYKILSVCMDLIIVEADKNVKVGDSALIMGTDGNDTIMVTEFSQNTHDVASQVVANLNKKRFDIVVK